MFRLRTSNDEVISCLKFFTCEQPLAEYLAIGHESGLLILLDLPSSLPGATKKVFFNKLNYDYYFKFKVLSF